MFDVWNAAIAWPNLPITVLLGLVVLYWLGVILGALDLDLFHLDLDGDVGADLDLNLDLDLDADLDIDAPMNAHIGSDMGHGSHGALSSLFIFLNMDKIPLTVVFSIVISAWWGQAVIIFHFFFREATYLAWPAHLATFFLSVLLTKLVTIPMTMTYRAMGGDVDNSLPDALGQIGTLDFDCDADSISQAVIQTDGAPLFVKTKSRKGHIPQGSRVLLIEKDSDGDFYYIEKLS